LWFIKNTVPRCDECDKVKSFLDTKEISYSLWNLRDREHSKYFGKVFLQISDKLKRNLSDNKSFLPILVEVNESREVLRHAQQLDEVRNLFG